MSCHLLFRAAAIASLAAIVLQCASPAAEATDEIQVYNAEIAAPGTFTLQQHLNYVWNGSTAPDFPGGFAPYHSLNGTPELAYGVTDWYELGLYVPFAVDADGSFLPGGFKLRHLFVSPHAEDRKFFYGLNIELSYQAPRFSQNPLAVELRPIAGVRDLGPPPVSLTMSAAMSGSARSIMPPTARSGISRRPTTSSTVFSASSTSRLLASISMWGLASA